MASFSNAFSYLQKIGKCMMLPVSVLPVAGILLGVGSAKFSWLPAVVSDTMAKSGDAIFGNLALIFAVGFGYETKAIMGIPSIDTGVFGGILIGAVAAALFNRYYRIQLPPYLGFFAGKRFVPIVTALAAIV